ncbi:MAG: MarC family protein [Bacteroidia bacterium]|jgi:multiple antibiotic resistance protein
MNLNAKEIFSVTMILFAVIDVIGSIPVLIDLKSKMGELDSQKSSLASLIIMVVFLFAGEQLLLLIGIDNKSFAVAGSFVLFFIAMEMILGIRLYKDNIPETASIVPIAFPLIAGAGTLTTLVSLKAQYQTINILAAIIINIGIVFIVLKNTSRLEKLLGTGGINILRKVFGIIILAIAVKLFQNNFILKSN